MSTTAEKALDTERRVTLGKYRVIAKLGSGGMADVYLAVAQGAMNVNRLVVVKRLREDQASDPDAREMFLNEARLAARLSHPNVVQTFEAGSEAGSYFLAMEYVDGQPFSRVLSKMMQERRRLETKLAVRIVADTLAGLHYAHELTDFDGTPLRIVHRDVSPQNMMLTYGGVTKIVDFGIAKAAGSSQTAHGVFKGKVAFMAPEQVLGENVDGRADVFAAGIVLWEALVGKHLMAAGSPAQTLHNLMHKPVPLVSDERADVPPALAAIVAKALERDVDARYASAKEMREDLEAFLTVAGGVKTEAVGELVSSLFADRKRSVQEQVKAQLAALSLARATSPDLDSISRLHVRNAHAILDLSDGSAVESQPSVFRVVTVRQGVVPSERPPWGPRVGVGLLVVTAVAALGLSAYALRRAEIAPATAAPPTVATVTVPVVTPASAPAPSADPTTSASASSTHAFAPPTTTTTTTTTTHAAATPPPARPAPPPPPARPTAAATPAPTIDAPRPSAAAPPPTATPEKPQGRTFRRDL